MSWLSTQKQALYDYKILTCSVDETPLQIHESWFSSPYRVEWELNNYNPCHLNTCADIQDLAVYCLPKNHILILLPKSKQIWRRNYLSNNESSFSFFFRRLSYKKTSWKFLIKLKKEVTNVKENNLSHGLAETVYLVHQRILNTSSVFYFNFSCVIGTIFQSKTPEFLSETFFFYLINA